MEEIPRPTTWDVYNPENNGINYQPQLEQDFFHQQYFPNGPKEIPNSKKIGASTRKQNRIERSLYCNYLGLRIGHKWWYYRYYVITCYLKCYQIIYPTKTICHCSHSDKSLVVLATKSELMNWGASTPENPQPGSGCYIYWSSYLLVNYYQLVRLGILFLQKKTRKKISWSNDLSASTWDSVALITVTLDIHQALGHPQAPMSDFMPWLESDIIGCILATQGGK